MILVAARRCALPLANKFREYHCRRDMYHTTIEYVSAFPVHFGLIDGGVSADGPFGVFAAPVPNETQTVIGGADLVAADWVRLLLCFSFWRRLQRVAASVAGGLPPVPVCWRSRRAARAL